MSNIKCPSCGIGNGADASNCVMCGCDLPLQDAAASQVPAFQGAVQAQPNYQGFQPQTAAPPTFQTAPQNYQTSHGNYGNNYANNFRNGNPRQAYQPQNLKSGLAIASLVLGCVAFMTTLFLIGILIAPVGLILGIVALVKVKKYPRLYGGKGMAIAGVVMNGLVLLALPMIAAIAIPNLLAARRAANEAGTISGIKTIAQAEENVLANSSICSDLPELVSKGLIDPSFANGTKFGYRYTIANLPSNGCEIYAIPTQSVGASATGSRSFYYSTEDKIIRAAPKQGKMADKNDLPLNENAPFERTDAGTNDTFFENQMPDNEKAARNLKTLHGAAMTYQATVGAGKCGTLVDLTRTGLISQDLGDGVDAGFRYNLTPTCEVSATPLNGGSTVKLDKFGNLQR
ncbi:MAG: DUF4190 domain-containing protein [Pyrinomonadaceae bacterium]|nr:DUF4190 domain-containing protein [Pyrinomonadaceae bacterium]